MRVALLADLHGNLEALDAVLGEARQDGVEHLLVSGDLVGYYYDVPAVLALLDGWPRDVVRGNHEEMLGAWRRGEGRDEIRRRYGSALDRTCELLPEDVLDELEALPHPKRLEIAGARVTLAHGTPAVIDRYVYPDSPPAARAQLSGDPSDVVVYGHTHYPVIWRDGSTVVVNPGSVGQPRDGKGGACWALWDAMTGEIQLRRAAYDPTALVEECRRRDPDVPYLADVLLRRR